MNEHPKFVCAREGHVTPLSFRNLVSSVSGTEIVQVCGRCGAEVKKSVPTRDGIVRLHRVELEDRGVS